MKSVLLFNPNKTAGLVDQYRHPWTTLHFIHVIEANIRSRALCTQSRSFMLRYLRGQNMKDVGTKVANIPATAQKVPSGNLGSVDWLIWTQILGPRQSLANEVDY
jgi:hypothetical protein